MSFHIENGLKFEINDSHTEATLLGFESSSPFVIKHIPNLYIPDFTRGDVPVTRIENNAFENTDEIETVFLPKSLKEISMCAFYGCRHLKKVRMNNSKQNILCIHSFAFSQCFELEEFDVFRSLFIMNNAFQKCNNLGIIYGPIVELEPYAFNGCYNLYKINFHDNAKLHYDSFSNCKIENIRCSGNLQLAEDTTRTLIGQETNVLCIDDSNVSELAYEGVKISCGKV